MMIPKKKKENKINSICLWGLNRSFYHNKNQERICNKKNRPFFTFQNNTKKKKSSTFTDLLVIDSIKWSIKEFLLAYNYKKKTFLLISMSLIKKFKRKKAPFLY